MSSSFLKTLELFFSKTAFLKEAAKYRNIDLKVFKTLRSDNKKDTLHA
jgi:hypothetical protein